jgi:hypothetical protein
MTMCRDCNQDVPTPCRNSNDRAGCFRFNEEPETAGGKCPKCGCQVRDPYGGRKLLHDVVKCGGLVEIRP